MPLNRTNSVDTVANSISLIKGHKVENLDTVITEGLTNVTGSSPENMETIEKVAAALDNDPDFFTTVNDRIDLKADQTTTYSK